MIYSKIEAYTEKYLGIKLSAYKESQLQRRIGNFISRAGLTEDEFIKKVQADAELRQKFVDFLTINVSEFFRNKDFFLELGNILKNHRNLKNLKIWSAACSYGCEPYTLAIIMNQISPRGNHKIIATDIDSVILDRARKGVYTEADIKNVDNNLRKLYFSQANDSYIINDAIKKVVSFKRHDLILDNYDTNLDLIVCRNVLIYFKEQTKKEIYEKFAKALSPGGLLFVGATESLYEYKELGFKKLSTFIYEKCV